MKPDSTFIALPGTRAPREPHGRLARALFVILGVLFALPFGSLGGALAVDAARATSALAMAKLLLGAGFFLLVALYGSWLAWRGLRGYSRPTPLSHRLLFAAAVLLGVAGAATFVVGVATVVRVGPVTIQHASWHSFNGTAWLYAMMSLALPFQLAAHEAGHILAGHLVGFEFLSIQVGPFCLDRPTGRWRVTWQPLVFGMGGRAAVEFHGSHRLPQRKAIFAAGGPAANLVFALVAWLAASAMPMPVTSASAVALGFLTGCAAEGLFLCALNLLPVRGTGTDGARILHALRPQPQQPIRSVQ